MLWHNYCSACITLWYLLNFKERSIKDDQSTRYYDNGCEVR